MKTLTVLGISIMLINYSCVLFDFPFRLDESISFMIWFFGGVMAIMGSLSNDEEGD